MRDNTSNRKARHNARVRNANAARFPFVPPVLPVKRIEVLDLSKREIREIVFVSIAN